MDHLVLGVDVVAGDRNLFDEIISFDERIQLGEVVWNEEVRDRVALLAEFVHDAVDRRTESIARPELKHITKIDNESVFSRGNIDPLPIQEDLRNRSERGRK